MKLWDRRDLSCFMHLLKLLFVSLILTRLYLYVCPWSKCNERKSFPWLTCVIRAKLWKVLKWTISSFWWKEINSRLTLTTDFNGSMLVKKILTHRKGPSKFKKWAKTKQTGSGLALINHRDYGIKRKVKSGLLDWRTLMGTLVVQFKSVSEKCKTPCSRRRHHPHRYIKADGWVVTQTLSEMFSSFWRKDVLPQEFKNAAIVQFYKRKWYRQSCNNYKGTSSLLQNSGKFLAECCRIDKSNIFNQVSYLRACAAYERAAAEQYM